MADHGPNDRTRVGLAKGKVPKSKHSTGRPRPKPKAKGRRGPASPGFKRPKCRGSKKTGTRNIA